MSPGISKDLLAISVIKLADAVIQEIFIQKIVNREMFSRTNGDLKKI